MFSGPVAGACANLLGCRAVSMLGGALTTAALCLSVLVTNSETLIFTFGVLGGRFRLHVQPNLL